MDEGIIDIPLHLIGPAPNFPAGLNPLVVMAVAHTLRNAADGGYGPCRTQPLIVAPDGERYVIRDGRHRWMAHWIAGLPTARCVLESVVESHSAS
jgi:hypothetical protein